VVVVGVCLVNSGLPLHADTIYVSNWNNDTVDKFDSVTGTYLGVFARPYHPRAIALDSTGNLYAIAWGSQSVMKYSPNGAESVFATGLQGGESVAVDHTGNVYVGNLWDNTILRFTPDGTRSLFSSTGDRQPNVLAFDTTGNLFVANTDANTIQKFTPDGDGSIFATGLLHPYGLAFDYAGNLFVANYWGPYYGGPSIQKFTAEGIGTVFATGMTDPAGLAFDSAGNLYVADQWGGSNYGSIERFTPDGVGTVFAEIYYGGPISIAILVPEPTTLTFVSLGLLALAIAGRRI